MNLVAWRVMPYSMYVVGEFSPFYVGNADRIETFPSQEGLGA